MSSIDTAFSRALLSEVRKDLAKAAPGVGVMRHAWVYHFHRDHWEFHGPGKFYWHGRAGNAYDARAKGWNAWIAAGCPRDQAAEQEAAERSARFIRELDKAGE